jgi:hypothetical protein
VDSEDGVFKPPYMSFQTFWNFIDELSKKPLPPRIDRSVMAGKSGTDQANLYLAFTSFRLIDEKTHVLPLLEELVTADSEQRKALLAKMITEHYAEPMRISANNGSEKDLQDVFRDSYPSIASGDTRRKAITFFLHAARGASLELSAHFPKTRSGSGAPGTSKPRKIARRKPVSPEDKVKPPDGSPTAPATWDTHTVELDSGGTVFVAVDVDLFGLNPGDRKFVLGLVDSMTGYKTPGTAQDVQEESP